MGLAHFKSVLWDRVLLNSPGRPQKHSSLDFPLQGLALKACASPRSWSLSHFHLVPVVLSLRLVIVPSCLWAFRLNSRTWSLFPIYFLWVLSLWNISKAAIHFELLKYKIWYWGLGLWWLILLINLVVPLLGACGLASLGYAASEQKLS